MDKKYSELDSSVGESVLKALSRQAREAFDKIVETNKWLTQYNFLVNAGGAAAILAYLGTDPTPTFAVLPLIIFLFGVIASGIEIRGLLEIYGHLQNDALRRQRGFVSDKLTVQEAASVEEVPIVAMRINHWSGIISQAAFILGCVVGVAGFFC